MAVNRLSPFHRLMDKQANGPQGKQAPGDSGSAMNGNHCRGHRKRRNNMRNKNSTLAALSLAAILIVQAVSAIPAYALYDPENPNPVYEEGMMYIMAVPISAELPATPGAITWNGEALDLQGLSAYVSESGQVMVPLRAVMEGLGYRVDWNAETRTVEMVRGAHWVTLKPGQDWYTFGKMAPAQLGTASELKENRTYVPVTFFTDVLPFSAVTQPDGVLVLSDRQTQDVTE
jgi:hypothetical protein